ncbi:MAG: NAD(P)H-dependent oxidoreductase subunit E [Deltaproteobacteria bacterium]|nr:NAD(P)H-dependent oxidoreductase subunit E [Candidatus Anaeroferrophillus wilburensis]MBN2888653.1 NAD(P)H-dependent oxidoreductase subunit E [Deltaproteobacteria bacterium]
METTVQSLIAKYGADPAQIIAMLQDLQSAKRYLPVEDLRALAESLAIPLARIYRIATFFKAFSLEPKGEHIINVCMGTACHVRGAGRILDELKRQLGVEQGCTTDDQHFSLETVNCLGACALGPVVVVDQEYHGDMQAGQVKKLVEQYR